MRRKTTTLIFLLCLQVGYGYVAPTQDLPQASSTYKQGAATVIQLGETGTQELFDRWLSQAMSGLFSAVAQKHIARVSKEEQEFHQNCSKTAQDTTQHAKCVSRLLKAAVKQRRDPSTKPGRPLRRRVIPFQRRLAAYEPKPSSPLQWEGAFGMARAKRSAKIKITQAEDYTLQHPYDEPTFAQIARHMTSGVRALRGRKQPRNWQTILNEVHQTADEDRMEKRKKKALMRRLKSWINNTPKKLEDGWRTDALEQMDDTLRKKEELLKKAKATEDVRVPLKVVREAIKLGMMLSGQNVTNFEKKTLRLGSPRFFSLVKDQDDEDLVSVFSPSLFSLHDEGGKNESPLSLPGMLKKLTKKEQQAWMDFVVEASGVGDAVDSARAAKKATKDGALRTPDGTPLYFNKKNLTDIYGSKETDKVDVFEKLAHNYDAKQVSALDKQGFAFMTEEQVEMMYGKDSPYHDAERLERYKEFARKSNAAKHRQIRNEIIHLGEHDYKFATQNVTSLVQEHKRRKRNIVLSPIINTPLLFASAVMSNTFIVLSPVVMSPVILSPAVNGPVILSPWVFIPVILSPRVLSPLIVNPLIFSPIILSPLVLHPLILSPGIFNPLILSPFVLSPFILSPQVFTPVILSPFALSPLILTPAVGSPLILSPFVLSPIILSPQVLFAVVLSPYALSPLVESKLIASEVVLSPSFLS